jgi:hypothetical protein
MLHLRASPAQTRAPRPLRPRCRLRNKRRRLLRNKPPRPRPRQRQTRPLRCPPKGASNNLNRSWTNTLAHQPRQFFYDSVGDCALYATVTWQQYYGITDTLDRVRWSPYFEVHTGDRGANTRANDRLRFPYEFRTDTAIASGKTGRRTVPLAPTAVAFFQTCAKGRRPNRHSLRVPMVRYGAVSRGVQATGTSLRHVAFGEFIMPLRPGVHHGSRLRKSGGSKANGGQRRYADSVQSFASVAFGIDVEHCPNRGATLKIIAAIRTAVRDHEDPHAPEPARGTSATPIALAPVRRYDSGSRQKS